MLRELRSARSDLGVIQVTHRLQSAADADWVLALEGGRVVAHGEWSRVQPRLASWSASAPAAI
jgi:ABC-type transport system involved in cytochrome bd biosynthesis fused ATPase/permease subunit